METSVYILLPVCVEMKDDVFLSIFRSIVGKTNVDKHPLNNALISGLKVETFRIEQNDAGRWNDMSSQLQQTRQAKMLGYWAIENFPSLGKKLCGDTWKAPHRKFVDVTGRDPMLPDEFDKFIITKMNIRILELNEIKDKDTLQRLKYFVRAPGGIAKCNRIQVSNRSKNMFFLDIENGFDYQQCWHALRSGVFSRSNVDDHESADPNVPQAINVNINSIPRIDQDSLSASSNVQLPKRRRRSSLTENDANTDAIDILTAETLQTMLVDIQTDVRNLNDKRQSKEVELLKKENSSLSSQVEVNAGLIGVLQRGSDAHYKLYAQSESQLSILRESIEKQQQIAVEKDKELETTKTMIQDLEEQLKYIGESDLNCRIKELTEKLDQSAAKNRSLDDLCNEWKIYAETNDKKAAEASSAVSDLQKQMETSKKLLAESTAKFGMLKGEVAEWKIYGDVKDKELRDVTTAVNILRKESDELQGKLNEATARNEKLDAELTVWKSYGDAKDRDLEEAATTVDILRKESDSLRSQIESMTPKADIEELQLKLNEATAKNGQLDAELTVWKSYGDAKDRDLEEAATTVDILRKESDSLRSQIESMTPKADIEELQGKLNEATAKNGQLDADLTEWKIYGDKKNEELNGATMTIDHLHTQLNSVRAQLDSMLPIMKAEIEELEKNLNESIAKNKTFGEEVTKWKIYGDAKGNELKTATATIDCLRKQLDGLRNETGIEVCGNTEHEKAEVTLNGDAHVIVDESADVIAIKPKTDSSNPTSVVTDQGNDIQSQESEDEDLIVKACKPVLMDQRFGWIKFNAKKNSSAWPGFVYPPDADGFARAQRITPDGYVADVKNRFFDFDENIPENEKGKAQVKALTKFNEKFKLAFV